MDIKSEDMKQYLAMQVLLKEDAQWLQALKDGCKVKGVKVRWQHGHHHITGVFVHHIPEEANWYRALYRGLAWKMGPMLEFDKLDVFTTSGGQHIIYLTASKPSEQLLAIVNTLRSELEAEGCEISHDFKLHVTLGRVDAGEIGLEELKAIVGGVELTAFSYQLEKAEFLEYKTNRVIVTFMFYKTEKEAEEALEERKRRAFRNALGNIQLMDPDF